MDSSINTCTKSNLRSSLSLKMGEGSCNPSCSTSTRTKRPSFFKVLVGDFTNELRVPRDFLDNFHGDMPKQSVLRNPTGRFWVVEMEKVEKDLFFCDGWETFVKEHGLEFGDFLVFVYIGNCMFEVKIYGRNACEKDIDLVIPTKTNAESNSHKKKRKVDHVATEKCTNVFFDGNRLHVKEKKNSIESKSHRKKQKVDHVAAEKCANGPYSCEAQEKEKMTFEGNCHHVQSKSHLKKQKVDVATEKCANGPYSFEALEKEKLTETNEKMDSAFVKHWRTPIVRIEENDGVDSYSCFTAECRPCTILSLTVPKKVAVENGLRKKKNVMLRDPDGKLWQVKIGKKRNGRFVLDQGWNAFWKEHNLGGGEICRFKFLENEVSVEIFRGGFSEYQSKIVNGKKEVVEVSDRRFVLVNEEGELYW